MLTSIRMVVGVMLTGITAAVVAQGFGPRFCLRGRFATDDVLVRDGEMYVPVSALARSMGLRVRQTGSTCDLVPQEAASGFRFEVLNVERMASYRSRLGFYDASVDAGPGRELVVVTCRLWNGTGRPQSIDLFGGRDTRLNDGAARSFAPTNGAAGPRFNGQAMILAGNGLDFALKFDVPAGFRADRLTFSVQNSFDQTPLDYRVSLRSR